MDREKFARLPLVGGKIVTRKSLAISLYIFFTSEITGKFCSTRISGDVCNPYPLVKAGISEPSAVEFSFSPKIEHVCFWFGQELSFLLHILDDRIFLKQ